MMQKKTTQSGLCRAIVVVDETDTDTEEISDKDDAEEEQHKVSLQSIVVVDETVHGYRGNIQTKDDAEEEHTKCLCRVCSSRDETDTDTEEI